MAAAGTLVSTRIMIPIVVFVPSVAIPPLVKSTPAMLSFSAEVVPRRIGLRTVRTVKMNFVVQPGLCVLNAVLTPGPRVGVSQLWGHEPHEDQEAS